MASSLTIIGYDNTPHTPMTTIKNKIIQQQQLEQDFFFTSSLSSYASSILILSRQLSQQKPIIFDNDFYLIIYIY
uniref:ADOR104 n=1 Tax=Adoxophyes orana granulovirus TaxID=170617 RepID=A0A0A7UYC0_GVAO|nr:ADOR104 [Adoxophyes orana granulovirus]